MIVVTGGDGQLGTAFRSLLTEAVFLTRSDLDLADTRSIRPTLEALDPELVINCAAFTAVDLAEEQHDLARLVNANAVGEMGWMCADHSIPFVTFSTDYVFGGESDRPWVESDQIAPINAYGSTKADGETAALQTHPDALVIRTSWLISGTHANFVSTILALASEQELKVVDDQKGSPTMAADLAGATLQALDVGATGLLHLVNQGSATWFDLAKAAVELAGLDADRVDACTTAEYPTAARRPAYSVLESERAAGLGVAALPDWRDSLPGVVEALYRNGVVEPR